MADKKEKFSLVKLFDGKFFDAFDILVVAAALTILAVGFRSSHYHGKNKLNGLTGVMVKQNLEKQLKKINGVKNADVEFFGPTVTAILYPWAGNYNMYSEEAINQIYSVVESSTEVAREFIILYDGDTGEKIYALQELEANKSVAEKKEPAVTDEEEGRKSGNGLQESISAMLENNPEVLSESESETDTESDYDDSDDFFKVMENYFPYSF